MKTKYLLNKSEDGCYIARVIKDFESEAKAEKFISWKRPEFYPDKKKRFEFIESTMIASIDLATDECSDSDETLSVTNDLESVDIVSTKMVSIHWCLLRVYCCEARRIKMNDFISEDNHFQMISFACFCHKIYRATQMQTPARAIMLVTSVKM